MLNYFYSDSIKDFTLKSVNEIIGSINVNSQFNTLLTQNNSWQEQIEILQQVLKDYSGTIFFEFSIPRMGKRIDVLAIINSVIFVIEFKVSENKYLRDFVEQVWDYTLELKNFHKPSHSAAIVPILVVTGASNSFLDIVFSSHDDKVPYPIRTNQKDLSIAIKSVLDYFNEEQSISGFEFAKGSYSPTPSIIEAAVSLYNNHSVEAITRSDADATNLTHTTGFVSEIIDLAKNENLKIICFVTGVPGAGKTLVGLNIATQHLDRTKGNTSVYLSGNGPLVLILQEALARDRIQREKSLGNKITKSQAKQAVKAFIQIIHHYRDEYLRSKEAPYDHVAIFDEAQRAWNKEQTVKFMRQKKNQPSFDYSEPEFLISCLDRHKDWAVIVCLVGGGQEINTGEAGISEWLHAIDKTFPEWRVYISPNLTDSEYLAVNEINSLKLKNRIKFNSNLHLGVSMRSFRSEKLAQFVKLLLDLEYEKAKIILEELIQKYPIVLTRNLPEAKKWLKIKARGSERYGIVVSSQAQRLKPFAIDVKSPINPINWFLDGKDDVRSSFYLEDVATEFHVQGLELDWACVTWDGDLRYSLDEWKTFSFRGSKWQNINNPERKKYLINAYRVLLTRARQGMVIVVPQGSQEDQTRKSEYYDSTFSYLLSLGIPLIESKDMVMHVME